MRIIKSQRLAKSTQESKIEEKTGDKIHNKILATLEALKTEIAQVSRQINVKEVKKRNKSTHLFFCEKQDTREATFQTVRSARQEQMLDVFIVVFVEVMTSLSRTAFKSRRLPQGIRKLSFYDC